MPGRLPVAPQHAPGRAAGSDASSGGSPGTDRAAGRCGSVRLASHKVWPAVTASELSRLTVGEERAAHPGAAASRALRVR